MDQAQELRHLAHQAWRDETRPGNAPSSRLIVVAGGRDGVGATTTAVHLAASLAYAGQPTVLVDADAAQPQVAERLGLPHSYTLADVLAGRDLHEALVRGPQGLQVLCGARSPVHAKTSTPHAQYRLIEQLRGLGPHAEFVVLDVGAALDRAAGRFWAAANVQLIVTTPPAQALMGAYAAIKLLAPRAASPLVSLVNQATAAEAAEAHARLARACQRFLGLSIGGVGHVPCDAAAVQASSGSGSAAAAFSEIALRLTTERWQSHERPRLPRPVRPPLAVAGRA